MSEASPEISEEIFRTELPNFRSIIVTLDASGGFKIDAQDMGPTVEEFWGDSDYEFWVTVPPEAMAKLAYALAKKLYAGRARAVDEFQALCIEAGVPHERGSWV
jgi:hypothetical protein